MKEQICFRHFGTMIDCSRNAVMKPEAVCKWAKLTRGLGFNTLMLYTEDVYEIDGQPYFGYGRGRYTKEELKSIDAFCREQGIELIPCIQTLAHLNAIARWKTYDPYIDVNDILLIGDTRTYELIEGMFKTLSECFAGRTVNIGMDEADLVGRGKYYDGNGDINRTELMLKHINQVSEIGKKYGFTLLMWSDMFYRLATGGNYYESRADIDKSVSRLIPDNVQLVYWDYYSKDPERYKTMLKSHGDIKPGTWFAGGLWSWAGFAPHNQYSIDTTRAAFSACREMGVQDVFLTLWGDDGAECARFNMLPSLFYASELAKGHSEEGIKERFRDKFGISYDDFMLLDLPGTLNDTGRGNAEKFMLYSDPFTGLFDSAVRENEAEVYKKCAERIAAADAGGYKALFDCMRTLCEVLEIKADLGKRTRIAYSSGNREELKKLAGDYEEAEARAEAFWSALREQWRMENKAQGFEVQDIRLGGVMRRLRDCRLTLLDFLDGRIDKIDELCEGLLPFEDFKGEGVGAEHAYFNNWSKTATAGVL